MSKMTLAEINKKNKLADKQVSFNKVVKVIERYELQYALFELYCFLDEDPWEETIKELEEENNVFEIVNVFGTYNRTQINSNVELKDYKTNSDEFWMVLYFIEQGIYVKLEGEYDSYGDSNHDYSKGISLVEPKQIEVIVYE